MCAENVLSFWCVFFCLDRFVYTCARVLLDVVPGPYLYFIVVGISLNPEFVNSARLMASKPQGSSHFYLPRSGITDTCH